jgi:mRNA interferase HigB
VVNVISRRKLQEFYSAKPGRARHAEAFEDWFKLARKAQWHSFQDVKALFGQTDVAKDTRSRRTAAIFDVGGNKYRIIALIDYLRQTVFITHVMDHEEYNRKRWKQDI